MTDDAMNTDDLAWLVAISQSSRTSTGAQLLFHLATEDGFGFAMTLDQVLAGIDRLILAGLVPSWRDGGVWRQSVGSQPRRDSALDPDQENMFEALVAVNALGAAQLDSLVEMHAPGERTVCLPVGVFLQCLAAAAWLGAVPPLDPDWAQATIPGWLADGVRKIRIMAI